MTVYLPTIKQLQYLVALRDYGHFGKAAESCFVTQSTLSASLRELETLVGVTLVERTRRVVRFTPLGQRIAEKARRVLREAEELADMARAEGLPLTGELRMGVIPTIAPFLLPAILPRLRAPLARTQAVPARGNQPGGVRRAPPRPARLRPARRALCRAATSRCSTCSRMRLLLAFPPRRPAAAKRRRPTRSTSIACCCSRTAIASRTMRSRPATARSCAPRRAMLGTSLHTLVQMVDNGLGLTLVPKMAVAAGILTAPGSSRGALDAAVTSRRIALAWRRGSPRAAEFRMLGEALIEARAV